MRYALQRKIQPAGKPATYWTGRDYSADLAKALKFPDTATADRHLQLSGGLRQYVNIVPLQMHSWEWVEANNWWHCVECDAVRIPKSKKDEPPAYGCRWTNANQP